MLTSLDIRETQIQATAKYHLTLVRMAIAKHSTVNDRGCRQKGAPLQHSLQPHRDVPQGPQYGCSFEQ